MAAPWEYTGGTLFWDPPGPLGQFWVYPENTLAEPNFGYRQIHQGWKIWQSAILTLETIFKIFENS